MRCRLLAATLTWLTDRHLADAIVGDLEEERRRRLAVSSMSARLWWWGAATTLVARLAAAALIAASGRMGSAARTGLLREAMQSLRALARRPAAPIVIVLTLGLGFGLNTAMFSIVHGVLFDPLPFDRPDELVFVEGGRAGDVPSVFGTSYPDYRDIAATQQAFSQIAICTYWTFTVTGTDVPLRVVGQRVSGSFFPLLGMRPAAGRWIDETDDIAGGPEVVVISHGLWRREFGGDTSVFERPLELNGVRARVVGVMPAAFRFPFDDVELWAPARNELDSIPRQSRFLTTIGRLGPGVRLAGASAEVERLAADLRSRYPDSNRDWHPSLRHVVPALTAAARPRLLLLFGAVVVVLLVACVNVTAIIQSRASARAHEFAVRRALGAGRARLTRLMLLDSAWLGAAGLCVGLMLAVPAVPVLRSIAPVTLPRLQNVALDWPVFSWAAVAMALFVIAGGLVPAMSLRPSMRTGWLRSARIAGSPRAWGRRTLIVLQVASAFALLAGAGLLVRSFSRVLAVDPGFDAANVATVRVFLTPPTYRSIESQIDYVTRAIEALATLPGVRAAGAVSQPPFDTEGSGSTLPIAVEGRTYAKGTHPAAAYRPASASYFETMGLEVIDGRTLTVGDRRGGPLVAVINRAMAAALWPGERAVGRRFEFADGRNAGTVTVVGVVGDVATDGLEQSERPAVYVPFVQRTLPFLRWMTLVVRTHTDVLPKLAAIRARLQAVDPKQPLYGLSTTSQSIERATAERRFSVLLMTVFAGLTLVLAALGLYGVLSQRIAERSREIGVRLALGARPAQIFRLVMGEGVALVGAGAGVGIGLVWLGAPLIQSFLFGVNASDPATYAGIVAVMTLTTLAAAALPSRAAARTDPVGVIRH